MKNWISALRLRTLPLSLSCIVIGSGLAYKDYSFNIEIFFFCILTTVLLQILSNLANDLGDTLKGTDNEHRVGPTRTVQSGAISIKQMKVAILICSILSILSGFYLIYIGTIGLGLNFSLFYIVLALLAVIAAIKYTLGKGAYGYSGFGDVFVFLFFGLVGVLGSNFLYTHSFSFLNLLPAISVGLFSVAVLNLNNMRDLKNDKENNKNTLVVMLGLSKAKYYHYLIILLGIGCSLVYSLLTFQNLFNILYLVSFTPFLKHLVFVKLNMDEKNFDPHLKVVALSTFIYAILFSISINL